MTVPLLKWRSGSDYLLRLEFIAVIGGKVMPQYQPAFRIHKSKGGLVIIFFMKTIRTLTFSTRKPFLSIFKEE